MTDAPSAKPSWKDGIGIVCALVSAAFVISGALRADGGRDKQLEDNTRRIESLERSDAAKGDVLTKIDGRTIRIETTLEMMKAAKEMQR
ncbi:MULTISPECIES: hypothetical protein [Sphingomonas]|uniref:Uncharacterized protein n=1 Tax=Sphingomonas molluscorum TaxID=418184 RepID=A0ABU8Q7H9_9SPHN|nr:hypothetical protein [Sphingomonas sp. JUb134]MBM7407047.1 hypothetical protein [Sphingomonas sp. JUb134]